MKSNSFKCCFFLVLSLGCFVNVQAQTYPFALPATVTASLNVSTQATEPANNLLLGLNFGGFNSSAEKTIFRFLNPVTVRFPSGVWSNWYDWNIDRSTYKMQDPTNPTGPWIPYDTYMDAYPTYKATLDTYESSNTKTGFPGLTSLYGEAPFDIVWTYNLNYDSNAKSLARLQDSDAKGLNVSYIELGNEQFWKDQRSERISTPEKYYPVAKSLSETLKAQKPSLRLSVPLGWRADQASYNSALTVTKDYFDAITLHKYVQYEKDVAVKSSDTYKKILTARLQIENSKNFVLTYAPGKKIWMTEWGVSCDPIAASFLGQADAYLYLFEKQSVFERAEWYGATTALNPLFYFTTAQLDGGGRPLRVLSNMRKTGFGATYEILRSVFENSTLLKSDMTCNATLVAPDDTDYTGIQPVNVDAVSARAVTKNGFTSVFVVNKTPQSVVFDLKFNTVSYAGSFVHEALSFTTLSDEPDYANNENPLVLIKSGTGTITLPPYSINKLSGITVTPPVIYPGTFNGIKNVPGQIEIEDYNIGEGVGFHDSSVGNSGGEYRTGTGEDVDIAAGGTGFISTALVGDEYTRYTIRVTESGSYHMNVNYKTSSTTSKPFAASLLPIDLSTSTLLFSAPVNSATEGIVKIGTTAVYQDYQSPNFNLTAGDWVLELKIPSGGAGPNYDYVTLVKDSNLGINALELNAKKIFVYPIPSKDGIFNLSEETSWEVYSISGAKVLSGNGIQIDLSAFSRGTYLLKTPIGSEKLLFQ